VCCVKRLILRWYIVVSSRNVSIIGVNGIVIGDRTGVYQVMTREDAVKSEYY
jgi:Ribonuclease P/MRP, subunit p29